MGKSSTSIRGNVFPLINPQKISLLSNFPLPLSLPLGEREKKEKPLCVFFPLPSRERVRVRVASLKKSLFFSVTAITPYPSFLNVPIRNPDYNGGFAPLITPQKVKRYRRQKLTEGETSLSIRGRKSFPPITLKSKKHKKQKPTEEERASSSVQGGKNSPL